MHSLIPFWTMVKKEIARFLKVPNNTIIPQLVTVAFYLLIFGVAIGTRIQEVEGVPYLLFILPGLFVQNLINGAYSNPSGSLWMGRHFGSLQDILMAPIGYGQMILAYIVGGNGKRIFPRDRNTNYSIIILAIWNQ